MKRDYLYLLHILKCIRRVEEDTAEGKVAFLTHERTQDSVMRNLQVMAESSTRLSGDLVARHPEIDWKNLRGFRNILVHDYLGLDLEQIWTVVQNDVPQLKQQITSMLKEVE